VRVLILTEDRLLTERLVTGFLYERFSLNIATTIEQAVEKARARRPHVALIGLADFALSPISLEELCAALRSQNNVGVVLLGVAPHDAWPDNWERTPDAYLAEPVTFRDTLALIYQILVTRKINLERMLRAGDIVMDRQTLRVQCQGQEVKLTPSEFNVLELLLLHPGQVFTPEAIFTRVWGYDYYGGTNAVGVIVSNLRRKLGICGSYLRTLRGAGYALQPPGGSMLP
jgi:DNA-binding response OmpR family regulator